MLKQKEKTEFIFFILFVFITLIMLIRAFFSIEITYEDTDVLISDRSSVIPLFFLTGKPIIYCHKKDCYNDLSRRIAQGFYWVKNWDELRQTLEMLKQGQDPMKEKRQEIIKKEFYIPKTGAGCTIKELIKKGFKI